MTSEERFIPTTMERHITKSIVFRPIRSWHSHTYAGENLESVNGDGSGCLKKDLITKQGITFDGTISRPYTVTHRLYWNVKNPNETISAFLSYPDAMGCSGGEYFWEIHPYKNDIKRFFGKDAEKNMEQTIKRLLQ